MAIRAICFDLDGLFFTAESFQNFKKSLAPDVETKKRDYVLALSEQLKAFKLGTMDEEAYRNWAKKELSLPYSNEKIFQILKESYQVNPQVEALAKKLKEKGYILCICSNNFPTRIRELDKKFWFLSLFDVHIFSYEVGVMKPDQRIFEVLIDKSWIPAHEIVYSDDKEDKLSGAKALGIQTFVFHSFDEFVVDLKSLWVEW